MYARRQTRPKPRASDLKKFSAPTQGWISNRALADPQSFTEGQGAAVLDNFFPKATSVILRRGKQAHATLVEDELDVTALFAYRNGNNERLFGANENVIYDLTSVPFSEDADVVTDDGDLLDMGGGDWLGWFSTDGLQVMEGFTGGEWIVAQFAVTGNVYLVGVNGADDGFIFDGANFYPYVPGGVFRLDYDAEATPFTAGSTVTGGTSGATGVIWKVDDAGTTGTLLLTDATGTFQDNEALTGGGGSATVDGVAEAVVPGPTFATSGLSTADMDFVWVYKNRLFFAQKSSMNAWYAVGVDAVGGDFDVFPLGGVFPQGGDLLFGAAWSLDGAGVDGLSEQCLFVSSLGEVAVYQGTDPGGGLEAWNKVGLYRVGTPLGRRAFLRGGGDIAIATTVGLVPLSKAIQLDVTALNVATVSYKIADAWTDAVTQRGAVKWQCEVWPESKMAVIAPPDLIGSSAPVIFVSNTETGAWARYTGWLALCMEVFRGRLYFGSPAGKIFIANVSGNDYGDTFSGAVVPLFEDMGSPASAKIGKVARARIRANGDTNDQLGMLADFSQELPAPPDATALTGDNLWGTATWGTAVWGEATPQKINQKWNSVGGIGYSIAPVYQVTSGSVGALDAELIDLEIAYTTAEIIS